MQTEKNIALAEDALERVREQAQAEAKTADKVVEQAVQRELARKAFERIRREAEIRRGSMTDEEVDRAIETAAHEWRSEQRGRQVERVAADSNIYVSALKFGGSL